MKAVTNPEGLIIPISKLLGNYNARAWLLPAPFIIPISKLLGNYNDGI